MAKSSSASSDRCPHCGRSWHATINIRAGSSGRDIVAFRRYGRDNGHGWSVGESGREIFVEDPDD